MSGKKQAFKDILRNCFPVVLDDLLDQPNQEKSDLDSIETKTGKKGKKTRIQNTAPITLYFWPPGHG